MDPIFDKFQPIILSVKEFDNWLVTVRTKQITLGAVVFLLKRPEPSLAGLNASEASEFPHVARWFEESAASLFNAQKFNYIAAMMKDPVVHFHALPRYSEERTFGGKQWIDKFWPKVATLEDVATTEDELKSLVTAYRGRS
jgi:diadenosine tetraphosphate (Ap4A) HIT family hydrolase